MKLTKEQIIDQSKEQIIDQFKELAAAIGLGGVHITPKAAYVTNYMLSLYLTKGDRLNHSDGARVSKAADEIFGKDE